MPTIPSSIVVSRPGTDLQLNNGSSLTMAEWLTPDPPMREQTVEGPWQAGSLLLSSVPGDAQIEGVIRVEAATWPGVVALANDVRQAFNQFSYMITTTLAGQVTTHTKCRPTGLRMIGGIQAHNLEDGWAEYAFSITYHPNTVEAL